MPNIYTDEYSPEEAYSLANEDPAEIQSLADSGIISQEVADEAIGMTASRQSGGVPTSDILTLGARSRAVSDYENQQQIAAQEAAKAQAATTAAQRYAPQQAQAAPPGGGVMGELQGVSQQMQDLAQQGKAISRQGAAGVTDILEQKKAAAENMANLQALKAQDIAALNTEQALERNAFDAQVIENEKERRRQLEDTVQKIRDVQKEAQSAEIDPNRLMNNLSVRQKVIGALGVVLSGIGAGITGGRNLALDAISEAVNRDIAAQRDAANNLRASVKDRLNEYALLRDKFGDDRSAESALQLKLIEQHKRQINSLVGDYASPEIQARKEEVMAGLNEWALEAKQNILGISNTRALQALSARGGILGNLASAQAQMASAAAQGRAVSSEVAMRVGSMDAANDLIDTLEKDFDSKTGWLSALTQYVPKMTRDMLTGAGVPAEWVPGQLPAEFDQQRKFMTQIIGKAAIGDVLQEHEFQRVLEVMPKASDSARTAKVKFEQLRNALNTLRQGRTQVISGSGYKISQAPDAWAIQRGYKQVK